MDPVTHTLVGASLSASGLHRATPMATTTLVIAANAPDIDIVMSLLGGPAMLAHRRGLTHGIPALFLLPFVVLGAILLWDRLVRLRRHPERPPVRPVPALALAYLGVWTHPMLDWLNTYGMRWLMPLSPRWSYGDALFIIDPWLWLLLGGAAFLAFSRHRIALLGWGLLAAAMSWLVLSAPPVPIWARVLWCVGLAGWVTGRLLRALRRESDPPEGAARLATAAAVAYILVMVAQTSVAEARVHAYTIARSLGPIESIMVGPIPADPFRSEVIVQTPEGYYLGRLQWLPEPDIVFQDGPLERHRADPVVRAASEHPDARHYLTWARFPHFEVRERDHGWEVSIRDVRYMGRAAGSLAGLRVDLDSTMTPIRTGGVSPWEPRPR